MGKDNENKDKEYEKLRREYRNMEVNRKTLAEENQNVSSLKFCYWWKYFVSIVYVLYYVWQKETSKWKPTKR